MTLIICLNMIVKNESKIITRLFESIKHIFDTFCICDTGSTDDTISVIKNWMTEHGKKGVVLEEPFRNFGYNRTFAIKQAQTLISKGELYGDYFLFLDADMKLVTTPKFKKDFLTAGAYCIIQKSSAFNYYNTRLVKTNLNFECIGVTHEYYNTTDVVVKLGEDVMFIDDVGDGGSKADKFFRDIQLLTDGLEDPLTNDQLKTRYYFYRANSFFDIKEYGKALEDYQRRFKLGGWAEEAWYARYRIAQCLDLMEKYDNAISAYIVAYQTRPIRAEPLYDLARLFRLKNMPHVVYMIWKTAKDIPYPKDDILFINRLVYEGLFEVELVIIGKAVQHPDMDRFSIKLFNQRPAFDILNETYTLYCRRIQSIKSKSTPDGALSFFKDENNQIVTFTREYQFNVGQDRVVQSSGSCELSAVQFIKSGNEYHFYGCCGKRCVSGKKSISKAPFKFVDTSVVLQSLFSKDDKTVDAVVSWYPFKIQSGTTITVDRIFSKLTSCSSGFKRGDCIWFVCDFQPNMHVIVVYNYKSNTLKYTVPFKFEDDVKVSTSRGIVVEKDKIVICYNDKLVWIENDELEKFY